MLLIPVILAQMLASTAPSQTPASARGVLESATGDVDGDGKPDAIRLEQRRTGVFLVVETAAGRRTEKGLGIEPLSFSLEGTATRLALADVNGDGTPEILAAAAVGDRGLLFVLGWNGAWELAPLISLRSGDDAFVADAGYDPESIRVERSGRVELATRRKSAKGLRATRDTWEWSRDQQDFVWTDAVAKSAPVDSAPGFRAE